MNDKVRGLVEKWRRHAPGDDEHSCGLFEQCADELEQALAAPAEGAGHWAMELAREIKANAEDHPEDYISKFALQWADQLAARAVTAEGAEVGIPQFVLDAAHALYAWQGGYIMADDFDPRTEARTITGYLLRFPLSCPVAWRIKDHNPAFNGGFAWAYSSHRDDITPEHEPLYLWPAMTKEDRAATQEVGS